MEFLREINKDPSNTVEEEHLRTNEDDIEEAMPEYVSEKENPSADNAWDVHSTSSDDLIVEGPEPVLSDSERLQLYYSSPSYRDFSSQIKSKASNKEGKIETLGDNKDPSNTVEEEHLRTNEDDTEEAMPEYVSEKENPSADNAWDVHSTSSDDLIVEGPEPVLRDSERLQLYYSSPSYRDFSSQIKSKASNKEGKIETLGDNKDPSNTVEEEHLRTNEDDTEEAMPEYVSEKENPSADNAWDVHSTSSDDLIVEGPEPVLRDSERLQLYYSSPSYRDFSSQIKSKASNKEGKIETLGDNKDPSNTVEEEHLRTNEDDTEEAMPEYVSEKENPSADNAWDVHSTSSDDLIVEGPEPVLRDSERLQLYYSSPSYRDFSSQIKSKASNKEGKIETLGDNKDPSNTVEEEHLRTNEDDTEEAMPEYVSEKENPSADNAWDVHSTSSDDLIVEGPEPVLRDSERLQLYYSSPSYRDFSSQIKSKASNKEGKIETLGDNKDPSNTVEEEHLRTNEDDTEEAMPEYVSEKENPSADNAWDVHSTSSDDLIVEGPEPVLRDSERLQLYYSSPSYRDFSSQIKSKASNKEGKIETLGDNKDPSNTVEEEHLRTNEDDTEEAMPEYVSEKENPSADNAWDVHSTSSDDLIVEGPEPVLRDSERLQLYYSSPSYRDFSSQIKSKASNKEGKIETLGDNKDPSNTVEEEHLRTNEDDTEEAMPEYVSEKENPSADNAWDVHSTSSDDLIVEGPEPVLRDSERLQLYYSSPSYRDFSSQIKSKASNKEGKIETLGDNKDPSNTVEEEHLRTNEDDTEEAMPEYVSEKENPSADNAWDVHSTSSDDLIVEGPEPVLRDSERLQLYYSSPSYRDFSSQIKSKASNKEGKIETLGDNKDPSNTVEEEHLRTNEDDTEEAMPEYVSEKENPSADNAWDVHSTSSDDLIVEGPEPVLRDSERLQLYYSSPSYRDFSSQIKSKASNKEGKIETLGDNKDPSNTVEEEHLRTNEDDTEEAMPEYVSEKENPSADNAWDVHSTSSDDLIVEGPEPVLSDSERLQLYYSSPSYRDFSSQIKSKASNKEGKIETLGDTETENDRHPVHYVQVRNQEQTTENNSASEGSECKNDAGSQAKCLRNNAGAKPRKRGVEELQTNSVSGDNGESPSVVPPSWKLRLRPAHQQKRINGEDTSEDSGHHESTDKRAKRESKSNRGNHSGREQSPFVVPPTLPKGQRTYYTRSKSVKDSGKHSTNRVQDVEMNSRFRNNTGGDESPSVVQTTSKEGAKLTRKQDKDVSRNSTARSESSSKRETASSLRHNEDSCKSKWSKKEPNFKDTGDQRARGRKEQGKKGNESTEERPRTTLLLPEYREFCDAEIRVPEGNVIHIFSTRRSLFRECPLLAKCFESTDCIELRNVHPRQVYRLLRYLHYDDKNFINLKYAEEDYRMAKEIKFGRYQDACVKYMIQNMNYSHAAYFCEFGIRENLPGLRNICCDFIGEEGVIRVLRAMMIDLNSLDGSRK